MQSYIKAISYYLPSRFLDNKELAEIFPEWSAEKISDKVGIKKRYIASETETAADMAECAILKLFHEHFIDPNEIDFLLLCTQSPDYFLPTTACVLQYKLGLPTTIGALDFNLGCSGFVYGLSIAKGLISAGIGKNILLVTSETYSKHIHPRDKKNRTIFGDAAAATLVSIDGFAEINDFILGTDGRGAENLIVKNGAFRNKTNLSDIGWDSSGNLDCGNHLYMNGSEIFDFTSQSVPNMVINTIIKNNLSINQINLFVFHQANKFMIEFLRKQLKIDKNKFYYFLEDVGNTVSSTIPIALYEAKKEEKLIKGPILLSGFGVGYSYGSVILTIQ